MKTEGMTNQTNVKLPKEIAEAIEHSRTITYSNRDLLRVVEEVVVNPIATRVRKWICEDVKRTDLLMQALVSGYEIEETPDEKFRKYMDVKLREVRRAQLFGHRRLEQFYYGERSGVVDALDILGIEIEGVNV